MNCSERNCKLKLHDLCNYVVLKGEKLCKDQRICDCIIFIEETAIGIVELKSKTAHSNEIKEKLTNGTLIALNILKNCNNNQSKFDFYHIVLCKAWSSSEYRVITSEKIEISGKRYYIIPKRCGVSFSEIIRYFK